MTPHFTDNELSCKCGCGFKPSQTSQNRLERVRVRFRKPMYVSSGARCPTYNAQVSGTGLTGPHTKGAFDIIVSGADAYELVGIMLEEGFTGIGISQKGPHNKRFIHADDLPNEPGQPRPTIWSY